MGSVFCRYRIYGYILIALYADGNEAKSASALADERMLARLQLIFVVHKLVPRASKRIISLCKLRFFVIVDTHVRRRFTNKLHSQTTDDLLIEIEKQRRLSEAAEQNSLTLSALQGKRILRHA